MSNNDIGNNIKKFRKERNLTQKKLGELLGISEVMISQYERGTRTPKIETIEKIASALEVNINQIKKDISWNEFRIAMAEKQINRDVSEVQGIISILSNIYGKIEEKRLNGKYASAHYYLIGEGEKKFVLHDGDISALYKATEAYIPIIVERIKDTSSEDEVIARYTKYLDDPFPDESFKLISSEDIVHDDIIIIDDSI